METQVFKALGDPVRLEMVKRLSDGAPHTLGELTQNLGISRQGARKQVHVLESANMVRLQASGREVRVSLDIDSLKRSRAFIAHLEDQWDARLQKFKDVVETQSQQKNKGRN